MSCSVVKPNNLIILSYLCLRQLEAYFSARPAYFIFSTLLRPLHADAAAMARSRSAAGPLPTRAEKSESGRASSSAG